jgi:hypothetical protein
MSTGERSHAVLDQDLSPPIKKVGEEHQIHHLWTNILVPEKPPRPGRQRRPATQQEIDLARTKEQREDQASDLKDRQAHSAINSETLT